ncbi:MAG: CHAD domain-containing protein [Terriglobia bacterium]
METCVGEAQEKRDASALHAVRISAKNVRYLIEAIHELGASGSDQALACLRHLQRHLGDWHDLEVLEQMMLEMVARPGFLENRLELAMEVERLVLRNRRKKKSYEGKFFQMIGNSEEWRRLTDWIQEFLSTPSAPPRRGGKEAYSPGFPPARA